MSPEPPSLLSLRAVEHKDLTHLLGRQGKHVWLIFRHLPMRPGWWDAPLALRDLAEAICVRCHGGMTFSSSYFCSNSLMNCVSRCEMKWNDYLAEMKLVLISNHSATGNTKKNYTNLIYANQLKKRICRSIIIVIQKQKTQQNTRSTKNTMFWMYLLPKLYSDGHKCFSKKRTTHFYL